MSSPLASPSSPPSRGFRAGLFYGENLLVVLALAAMVLLPLTEIVLRKAFHTGISGSSIFVQHLTLLVGMLGGALAARDNRLLAMAALTNVLKGKWKSAATLVTSAIAIGLTVFLVVASWQFIQSEQESGNKLPYNIPVWIVQLILPLGFAVVAWRMARHAADQWGGRILALALGGLIIWLALHPPVSPEKMVWPCLGLLLVAAALGSPIFVTLGGAALILFWGDGQPIAAVPISQYKLVTDPSLPSIPLFTLAGYFLAEGGASRRLLRVFQALVGHFRGGPAIVTCLVCAFFTTFTGASGVTILALGGLLMPVLVSARYSERNALGLVTSAGSLGLLFPPCLPLILYGIVAGKSVTIKQMFLGGILPGVLLVMVTAALGVWQAPKDKSARQPFNLGEAGRAIWAAKWELLLPAVAFAGLFGGFATPVETAALTALYAFIVQTFVYRDLTLFRDVPRVMTECGLVIGGVLMILGVALGFTYYLVDAQIPDKLVAWASANVHSKWVFLLGLNVVLILVGGLIEIYAAIVVVVPLLVPIGNAMGLDPVHLGIIFLANMELGFLAPPVGLNLLLSSYRFNKPIGEVIRSVLPMLAVLFIGVLLITYFPPLTTLLPRWFGQ